MSSGVSAPPLPALILTRREPARRVARVPAWTLTAGMALAYLIIAPKSADLAAATYRSNLFGRLGFTIWDNGWYGGHHLPAYSVFAPALGWLLGPALLAALSMTLAAALFAALIEGHFPPRATRLAALWFAFGAGIALLSSRVPFDVGLAVGLGALLAAQHGRRAAALALALACPLASPVAGAFLALATLAWALAGEFRPTRARPVGRPFIGRVDARRGRRAGAAGVRRWLPAAMTLAALAPIAALELAFPEGGSQPFAASAFYPGLAGVLVLAALTGIDQPVLKLGTVMYACAYIASYVLPTALGANVDRLGALVAGPVAALVLDDRSTARRVILLVLGPLLLYWQVNAPLTDFVASVSDPSVAASYYAPLLGELRQLGVGYDARPVRIEVVPTVNHWEAAWVAPHVAIARGWERQLDDDRNGVFYASSTPLTAAGYEAWLHRQAIAYVALPDASLDYSGKAEAKLLRTSFRADARAGADTGAGGLAGGLREVWRSAHWRLFAVTGATALAQAPAVLTRMGSDSLTLAAPAAGRYVVRVRYSSYWALASGHGCVGEAPDGWTYVQAARPGTLQVRIDFSLARVLGDGPRCR